MFQKAVLFLFFCSYAFASSSPDFPTTYRWAFRSPYSIINRTAMDTGKGSRHGAVNSAISVVAPGTPDLKYVHAAMLERLPNGSLAAVWQGSPDFWEGSKQQGIYWAVSNDRGVTWSTASQLAAPQDGLPVWAPVLFSEGGRVHLFFSGPTGKLCSFSDWGVRQRDPLRSRGIRANDDLR
eukprot:jgi/Botrbrau1/19878/Bobra.0059s0001.2